MTDTQLAIAICFATSAASLFGLWQHSALAALFAFTILSLAIVLVDAIITRK